MTGPARRVLRTAAGFAGAGAVGFLLLSPWPAERGASGLILGMLQVSGIIVALGGGGWVLWRAQQEPEPAGRWAFQYLLLLFLFAAGYTAVAVNFAGPVAEIAAGMAGAALFGGVWALVRGYRHLMGYCSLIPAVTSGAGDGIGWLLGHGVPGATGWMLRGALLGAGLGSGLALALGRMGTEEPRSILLEELRAHKEREGGEGAGQE